MAATVQPARPRVRSSASTRDRAVSSEVRQGIRRSTDARRISKPSRRGTVVPSPPPAGETVLTTRWTAPSRMTSTTLGWPWRSLSTRVAGKPARSHNRAVPSVTKSRSPSRCRAARMGSASSLSASAMEQRAAPSGGRSCMVARNALYCAWGRSNAIPMASPVDFISGPRTASTARSLAMEKTGAFTAYSGRLGSRPVEYPHRDARDLTEEGDGAAGAWVDFQHVGRAALDDELDVDQPDHCQGAGDVDRLGGDPVDLLHRQVQRRI